MLQYVHVLKSDIPINSSIQQLGSVPTPTQIAGMANPSKYIQVTTNSWYYELCGKKPENILAYGELAIAYAPGYERLYIVNGDNDIVEFRPYTVDKTSAHTVSFENDTLASSGGACVWSIPFSEITSGGINPDYATIALRNLQTGEQVVPDVVFDSNATALKITIYSRDDIPTGRYRAIITGINYTE